jgi:hypothetical protein
VPAPAALLVGLAQIKIFETWRSSKRDVPQTRWRIRNETLIYETGFRDSNTRRCLFRKACGRVVSITYRFVRHKSTRSAGVQFCRSADQAVHAANAKAGSILLSLSARHGPEIASLLHRLASNCQVAEATRQGGGNATGDDFRAESYSRFREFENSRNRKIRNSLILLRQTLRENQ